MADEQARGLRRLFDRRAARLVGIAGEDGTGVTLELARALAQRDLRVLLLDRSAGAAARGFGLRARCEWRHALAGERTLRQVALDGPSGIVVLPAARALADADRAGPLSRAVLLDPLERALGRFDFMLVNGAPPALADASMLLTLAPTTSALTAAYTELKKLARRAPPRHCEIVVQRAQSEAAALDAFDSVAITAGRFLGMSLALAGVLPGAPTLHAGAGAPGAGTATARARAVASLVMRIVAVPEPRRAVNL